MGDSNHGISGALCSVGGALCEKSDDTSNGELSGGILGGILGILVCMGPMGSDGDMPPIGKSDVGGSLGKSASLGGGPPDWEGELPTGVYGGSISLGKSPTPPPSGSYGGMFRISGSFSAKGSWSPMENSFAPTISFPSNTRRGAGMSGCGGGAWGLVYGLNALDRYSWRMSCMGMRELIVSSMVSSMMSLMDSLFLCDLRSLKECGS